MVSRDCLSAEALGAYAAGTRAAVDVETIDAHLRACNDCVARLDALAARPDPLVAALRGVTPPPQARELARAIAAVLAGNEAPPRDMASSPAAGTLDPLLAVSQMLSSAPAAPLAAGSLLNEYRLLERLGAGGMGTVYRALHVRLDKEVALKVIQPLRGRDPQMRARFQREMKAIGKLRHPHIVLATDAGEAQGVLYLVMELEQGTDLADYVRRQGRLPVAEACTYAHQAALGLQCAHEVGLVHRDVKPSNLFRTASGQIKLLDLGLALLEVDETPGNVTLAGSPAAANGDTPLGTGCTRGPMGTDDYMAPEQWCDAHQVDARADLYGLGCTLFYLLTGQPPFSQADHSTREQKRDAHRAALPPRLRQLRPDVSPQLDALVQRLLAKGPQDRPKSAADVAHDLARVAARSPRRVRAVVASVLIAASVAALTTKLPRWPHDSKAEPLSNSLEPATAKAIDRPPTPLRPLAIAPMTSDEAQDLQNRLASQLQQPVVFANSLDMQFALIPPGEYMDPYYGHHTVGQPFYLGVTEVTMGQFRRFVEASGHLTDLERYGPIQNPSNPGRLAWHSPGILVENEDCPVMWVSWNDCVAYCAWLSRTDRQSYRLPRITEWIWASRAGHVDREFPGGKEGLLESAWIKDNSHFRPHPVRQLRPNAWGLYDTLGNVCEWTWDSLGADRVRDSGDAARQPAAGSLIGNSFRSYSGTWKVSGNDARPTLADTQLGFRVLCEVNPGQATTP